MMENLAIKKLIEKFPDSISEVKTFREEVTATVTKKNINEICKFLYSDPDLGYDFLTDLCGVDLFPQAPRFWKDREKVEVPDDYSIVERFVADLKKVFLQANYNPISGRKATSGRALEGNRIF
jgi:NADH:ubiquinone oxidoreductase subunit C